MKTKYDNDHSCLWQTLAIAVALINNLTLSTSGAFAQAIASGQKIAKEAKPTLKMTSNRTLSQLPSNFALPVYPNNVLKTVYKQASAGDSNTTSATINTGDSPTDVYSWYQGSLTRSGWTIEKPKPGQLESPLAQEGGLCILRAKKDDCSLMVICAKPLRAPYTMVNLCMLRH